MRYSTIIISIFALSFVSACGKSPVTHHKKEAATARSSSSEKAETECPLFFEHAGLCAQADWLNEEKSSLSIKFWEKANGSPKTGPFVAPKDQLFVQPWMPEHNHGVRKVPQVKADEKSLGIYTVTDIFYSMEGKWEVRIQLRNTKNEVVDQSVLIVEI